MNDEIIRMAREAGLHRQQHNLTSNPVQYRYSYNGYEESLERFYNLIVQHERETIAKMFAPERELVAFAKNDQGGCLCCGFTPKMAAAAIRARGEKQ